MYYSVIEWTAKLRAWAASEKRKEIGRETFHAQRAIRNFAALSDPNIRAWRMREEERKLARLQGELRARWRPRSTAPRAIGSSWAKTHDPVRFDRSRRLHAP